MFPARSDMRLKVRTFRVPMFLVAVALLGLIAVLATLQYQWLGRISDAERDRMTANLAAHSSGVAQDFDHELTRAYLTFQLQPMAGDDNIATTMAARHDRWTATARYPRLVRDVYIARVEDGTTKLQRFSATSRFVEPIEWPESLAPIRASIASTESPPQEHPRETSGTVVISSFPPAVWDDVPALVLPMPVLLINRLSSDSGAALRQHRLGFSGIHSYVIVHLDREYVVSEMLPAMVEQRFRSAGAQYQVAVVSTTSKDVIYTSDRAFAPAPTAKGDASAEFFHVRPQDFSGMVSEIRRFATATNVPRSRESFEVHRFETPGQSPSGNPPVSIMVQQSLTARQRSAIIQGASAAIAARPTPSAPRWRLVVKHPSGSLETAVNSARRRNIFVSSSVMALLGISVGFLIVTTRRAQELARQQMEFVAAVSHELRTPLAVIRSAADNLAEGVVHDHPQVKRYGDLVRVEGRRLSDMVEQILELAGIQSGQRSFALRPVALLPLLHDVVRASSTLIEDARLEVELDVAETLPPVLGEEVALRRVFQNLLGNAIKYGAAGGWIGIKARTVGREIAISVADRGMGIPPSEQSRIFDAFYRSPNVVEAQIQGAGLGLSLVQRIVEAHGGHISVRSAERTGSEFTVHLPAASEEPVARASVPQDAAPRLP